MQQIRKLSKNQQWFKQTVEKCKNGFKEVNQQFKDEENKYSKNHFYALLTFISSEAQLKPPTKEEAYELFEQFNDLQGGKERYFLQKEQFQKFCLRMFQMLEAAKQA